MSKKLEEYREDSKTLSGKVSDFCKELSFAVIAIVWMIKGQSAFIVNVDFRLKWALILSVLFSLFHLIQYLVLLRLNNKINEYMEKEKIYTYDEANPFIEQPSKQAKYWGQRLFFIKVLCITFACIFLIDFILRFE